MNNTNNLLIDTLIEEGKEFLVKLKDNCRDYLYIHEDGSKSSNKAITHNIGKYGRVVYSLASENAYDFVRSDYSLYENGFSLDNLYIDRVVTVCCLDCFELIDIENRVMYESFFIEHQAYFTNLEQEYGRS